LLLAREAGHEVVCLGHIKPPSEDGDSYMYQSAGSNIVTEYYEELWSLPLVIRESNHKVVESTVDYKGKDASDEVEDLRALVKSMKENYGIEGVISGAVFSDYQRLRVENVCSSLDIISFAPLWHLDQETILDMVTDRGIIAIMCKSCSVGLDETHIGQRIDKDLRAIFTKLHQKHGFHVAGEGGEYESLTLGVKGLPKRIEINKYDAEMVAPDQYILKIILSEIVDMKVEREDLKTQNVLGSETVFDQDDHDYLQLNENNQLPVFAEPEYLKNTDIATPETDRKYLQCIKIIDAKEDSWESSAQAVFKEYSDLLTKLNIPKSCVIYNEVQLADLSQFKLFNKEYVAFFSEGAPPARACTETNLDEYGITVAVYALNKVDDKIPEHLHVQSLSLWATPCVGPYSQTVYLKNVTGTVIPFGFSGTIALNSLNLEPLRIREPYRPDCARNRVLMESSICTLGLNFMVELIVSLRSVLRVLLEIGASLNQLSGLTVGVNRSALDEIPCAANRASLSKAIKDLVLQFCEMFSDLIPPHDKGARLNLSKSGNQSVPVIVNSVVFPALPKGALCEIMPSFVTDTHKEDVVKSIDISFFSYLNSLKYCYLEETNEVYVAAEANNVKNKSKMKGMLDEINTHLKYVTNGCPSVALVYMAQGVDITIEDVRTEIYNACGIENASISKVDEVLPMGEQWTTGLQAVHVLVKVCVI